MSELEEFQKLLRDFEKKSHYLGELYDRRFSLNPASDASIQRVESEVAAARQSVIQWVAERTRDTERIDWLCALGVQCAHYIRQHPNDLREAIDKARRSEHLEVLTVPMADPNLELPIVS